MAVILKQSDVEVYRNISNNFDQDKFDAFALEVQETTLRELLRDPLYYQLVNDLDGNGDPQTQRFIDLVNGKAYTYDNETIQYYGLKPYLAYHWLALNLREGDYFAADYGNIQFSSNEQDNMTKITDERIDRINSGYYKKITSYRNNIVQYLNEEDGTYPEWEGRSGNKPKDSFNILTT
ncbi:MAG: hypothetical protein GWN62_20970 [Aliifodinibius sp.]|nr:hypothetical protein [Fodinibius sp.]